MMMMRGVLLQRALRTASVCDRALIFTSAVHQSCPAVEELATSESGHVEELQSGPTGLNDMNRQCMDSRYAVRGTTRHGTPGRTRAQSKPASELIQDPRIMMLFKLVRERKFKELQAAHEQMMKEEAESDETGLDVYFYSRLMTQCVRHAGNETALPVFELMTEAGVTPNVVPYTIVIRALMDLADNEKAHHSGQQGLNEVAKSETLASKAVELLHEMRGRGIRPNELTYKPIMSWLPARKRDAQFQELKNLMAEDGVAFDGVFKFYEIRLALKVGDLKKAERLYIAAKKENAKIASSLDAFFLSAFAQEDRVEELIELLPKVLPVMNSDKGTASAFQCLGRHGKHQAAMKCLTSLKKSGGSSEQLNCSFVSYILGSSKAKKLEETLGLWRDVEEQCRINAPPEVFNILIDSCCKHGHVSWGLDLLDEMQQRGTKLSPYAFNPFICDFARWGMYEEAFEMKAAMGRLGVQPSVVTYSTLVNCCVKLGDMEQAYNLLAEMKQARLDRALEVLREMLSAGVQPDSYTYSMLIFACSMVRNEDKAVELFEEMLQRGVQPNAGIYSAMASVFARCGKLERSIEMVKEIERRGEVVGTKAKSAILAGLSLAGRLGEALALYGALKREGAFPEAYAAGILLVAVGKAGDLDRMFNIFEDCRKENLWTKLTYQQRAEFLNVRCINVVLGCIRHNQLGRALEFLRKVKDENIADVAVLFDKIFLHISNGGRDANEMCWLDVDDGFAVVAAMRELGLSPSRMALEALLDGCASMNDSEQAQRVVSEMEKEGLALNVFSQIRLFRAYVAAEDEEKAIELLQQIDPYDWQDVHVQFILQQTLQPHLEAAQDSPEAAQAPETLPGVRQKLAELIDLYPYRQFMDD
ncbi:uncharacterized protein [Physcomitrium patens]|uniref:PROP1-like PPR domain-containing protein n=1 Tax=Physcomitrium patens TaxID=3218 RepID=A0A7I4A540_PHYPA|nr:pentatricopeptide repeat-containing protein At4g21880, mitochondrial-like isoform X2 [Physcomitrium patens]|eukprot:XP_024387680.1 pentatricopeptide repeat-containing protein At4g21880, mitochondrial-like isoform X2 [Physcomitrella patens]